MVLFTNDLIRSLSKKHYRTQAHYRQALHHILAEITEQLERGHELRLIGFGTFYTRKQPAGKVKHIRTGKQIDVPAHRIAAFHAGELLKRAVRRQPRVGKPRKKSKS